MLKQTRALLCHIWQQYEIDNIDLIVDYLMAQMDMSRQQREAGTFRHHSLSVATPTLHSRASQRSSRPKGA